MTKSFHGTVRGRTIELDEDPGVPEGQQVEVEVRLVAPVERRLKTRRLGTLQGSVTYMASDFDAPLDEFKEYMP